jgi:hypothetical protein
VIGKLLISIYCPGSEFGSEVNMADGASEASPYFKSGVHVQTIRFGRRNRATLGRDATVMLMRIGSCDSLWQYADNC